MPYVGRTPSAVPVTVDDIPANSIDASKIVDGSIELAEIADNSITDAKLNSSKLDGIEAGATADQSKADIEGLGIAASSITGALPAISGANLTGINAVVVGTTLPSPVSDEGSLFYKSDTDIFYISDGTQWNLVANSSPSTTGGTVTIAAIQGDGTFSYNLGTDFDDDVDTDGELTYTLSSGTMPAGCTLPTTGNSAFTGSASDVASNTNYTWTIKATDKSGGTATQDYQQTITPIPFSATGGTITTDGSYKVHTFTSSGTFTANQAFTASEILIVAGGGGGGGGGTGYDGGGGGGGGALLYQASKSIAAGSYTITIGMGGSGGAINTAGASGGNTAAFSATAYGGGLGEMPNVIGGNGGSSGGAGGGGAAITGKGVSNAGIVGTFTGYVNKGGKNPGTSPYTGSGGGGAGGDGSDGGPAVGHGGAGRTYSISGSSLGYAGGGGGGSGNGNGWNSGGTGSHGGGHGGGYSSNTGNPATAGVANTGGGGGGGRNGTSTPGATAGAAGGSGIVIVRYAV